MRMTDMAVLVALMSLGVMILGLFDLLVNLITLNCYLINVWSCFRPMLLFRSILLLNAGCFPLHIVPTYLKNIIPTYICSMLFRLTLLLFGV